MTSQKCYECALKHTATALSYAKEIIGGHNEKNDLDHRIDLLGELCNLEHHLELLDRGLLTQAQEQRRMLQAHGMAVDEAVIHWLRDFYLAIEQASILPDSTPPEAPRMHVRSEEAYEVVIDHPVNAERFMACYEGLRKHVMNDIHITAINPEIDVPPDVAVYHGSMKDFVEAVDRPWLVYMSENNIVINRLDFNLLPDTYLQAKCQHPERYPEAKHYPYEWDSGAPHVLDTKKLLETYQDDVLNDYFIGGNVAPVYPASRYVVRIKDKLCCGTLNQANSGYAMATVLDDGGFASLMEWQEKRNGLLTNGQK